MTKQFTWSLWVLSSCFGAHLPVKYGWMDIPRWMRFTSGHLEEMDRCQEVDRWTDVTRWTDGTDGWMEWMDRGEQMDRWNR